MKPQEDEQQQGRPIIIIIIIIIILIPKNIEPNRGRSRGYCIVSSRRRR